MNYFKHIETEKNKTSILVPNDLNVLIITKNLML